LHRRTGGVVAPGGQSTGGDYWRIEPAVLQAVADVDRVKERLKLLGVVDGASVQVAELLGMLDAEF
jgi:hypothetical protein